MEQVILTLTRNELQDLFANAIEQALNRQKKQSAPLLTIKEAGECLKVTQATIYNYINKGQLTPIKVNGITRLDADEVSRLIKNSRA